MNSLRTATRPSPRRASRAFTLLEMVVVIAIIGAVVGVLAGFNTQIMGDIRNVTLEVKKGREGPAIIRMIERDLQNAYADARMESMFEAKETAGKAEIRFVTSRNSVLFLEGTQSDLVESGYRVESSRNDASRQLYSLWRREDQMLDKLPMEGGEWIQVADNIVEFEVKLYDLPVKGAEDDTSTLADMVLGGDKLEEIKSWDKEKRYLPYAVKITLAVDIREAETRFNQEYEADGIQWYTTVVRLPPFSRLLPVVDDKQATAIDIKLNTTTTNTTGNNTTGGNNTNGNTTGGNNTGGNNTGGNNTGGNNTGGNNTGGR
jgi:prepilin-type N-terminal cleavage/methylation domain-containing protein